MIGYEDTAALRRRAWASLGITVICMAFCAGVLSAPLLEATGHRGVSALVRALLGTVCHQIPGRSFTLAGALLPVCARCAGLYFGFLGGCLVLAAQLLERRITRPPRRAVLLWAVLPSAAEWGLDLSGVAATTGAGRALTGSLLGFILAFYFVPAIDDMRGELSHEARRLFSSKESMHAEAG